MIALIIGILALSFLVRHGFFASILAVVLLPFVMLLAIPGFIILAGIFVALGG
jgi:hypothetical protein